MNQSDTAETIISLRHDHPQWTLQQIAAAVGRSRERVRQVLSSAGMRTSAVAVVRPSSERKTQAKLRGPTTTWTNSGEIELSKGDIGTITELLVCADLVRRGHDVYRAVNPSSPADLVVYIGGRCQRVEVKATQMDRLTGRWYRAAAPHRDRYDILAMVAPTGEIRYRPLLPVAEHRRRN